MTMPGPSAVQWRKASRSDHQGGACVEVAGMAPAVGVRDSKNPDGPKLIFVPAAWRMFTERIKASGFDPA